MSHKVIQRQTALADIRAAAAWYESRRRGGRAAFRAAVARCVADIARMPELWAVVADDIRARPVDGYPYLVYYQTTPTRVLVIAVRHTARDTSNGVGGSKVSEV